MQSVSDDLMAALMRDMSRIGKAEILPRFRAVQSETARAKSGPDDLVTDADLAAERALSDALRGHLPDVVLVGEEAAAEDPAILSRIGNAPLCAIIDPVDGTWNFAHGVPVFGMILAIVAQGQTIAGLFHYPVTGDFIVARRGQGAWHIAGDGCRTRLSVSNPAPVSDMAGIVNAQRMPVALRDGLAQRLFRFRNTKSWGCSAYEHRLLSSGGADFLLTEALMPWDYAAGVLIHAEAGGVSALLDGTPYAPTMINGNLLLAPDRASWQDIRAVVTGQV